ncbi:HAD-IA family hydrolase [Enterococcus sp. MMGLQ5-2]|nr:HAD-IA family hydrolase [Enterococcus sp. MMGLQ5-2]MBS7585384.1 HAD-IA family hydrolase [Enterococcus sp. MMGLQ5-1]NPD13241.1 HAD-IA family hydrolase [Enterococcus sp. MMGLQ5-1]NPD37955.1 HAD-IA family hydrolase [Enterococcus sp. MMGLQ5-2]
MKYENYIWDLGGTLIDSYAVSVNVFKKILAEFGILTAEDMIYRRMKKSSTEEAAKFFGVGDIHHFMTRYRAMEKPMQEKPVLFPGAKETLEAICNQGGQNFVISHRDHSVNQLLENAGIKSLFTEIVTSDNQLPRKPNPSSINYLIDKYHLEKSKTILIGDRALDIEAGENAEISTALFKSDIIIAQVKPTYTITELKELLTI